jgi:hypothetical protein
LPRLGIRAWHPVALPFRVGDGRKKTESHLKEKEKDYETLRTNVRIAAASLHLCTCVVAFAAEGGGCFDAGLKPTGNKDAARHGQSQGNRLAF